jgi:hypothetical protein
VRCVLTFLLRRRSDENQARTFTAVVDVAIFGMKSGSRGTAAHLCFK